MALTQFRKEQVEDYIPNSVQTVLDLKAPINNASFTGTFALPNASLVITGGSANSFIAGNGAPANFTTTTRAVVVGGVTLSNTPITSTDSVSVVIGKLQGQINGISTIATLDFPSTTGGTSSDLTVSLTGAVLGDIVLLGTPVQAANGTFTAFVSAANVVTVRYNNYSSLAINPNSGDFKIKIIR